MIAQCRIDPQMFVAPDLRLGAVYLVVRAKPMVWQVAIDEDGGGIFGGDFRDQGAARRRRTGLRLGGMSKTSVAIGNQHQRIGQR